MQCKGLVAHIPDAPNGTGIFTYIYHKCKPKVGKYSIHGATGYLNYLLYTVFHGQKGLVVPSHHTHTHTHVPSCTYKTRSLGQRSQQIRSGSENHMSMA